MSANVLGLQEYFKGITEAASKVSDIASTVDKGVSQVAQAQANADVTRDNASHTGNFDVGAALQRKGPGGIPTWALALGLVGFYFLVLK